MPKSHLSPERKGERQTERQTERRGVAQLRMAAEREQNVLGLEIAVDYVF